MRTDTELIGDISGMELIPVEENANKPKYYNKANTKVCPVCGSAAITVEGVYGYFVACVNCTASTGYVPEKPELSGYRSEKDAVAAWNKRTKPTGGLGHE